MEILTTIITSSIVVGIFVFVFKESFKAKLESISKDIDSIKSFQEKDFDYVSDSMKKIWGNLADIDDYLRHGIAHDIDKGQLSNMPLRPYLLEIKKEMALLPDDIYVPTETCLSMMSDEWVSTMGKIEKVASSGREGKQTEKECIDGVNSHLSELRAEFNKYLSDLRTDYRAYISKHVKNT